MPRRQPRLNGSPRGSRNVLTSRLRLGRETMTCDQSARGLEGMRDPDGRSSRRRSGVVGTATPDRYGFGPRKPDELEGLSLSILGLRGSRRESQTSTGPRPHRLLPDCACRSARAASAHMRLESYCRRAAIPTRKSRRLRWRLHDRLRRPGLGRTAHFMRHDRTLDTTARSDFRGVVESLVRWRSQAPTAGGHGSRSRQSAMRGRRRRSLQRR
jgi:hypothetical protein